jgi:hypothetical protein
MRGTPDRVLEDCDFFFLPGNRGSRFPFQIESIFNFHSLDGTETYQQPTFVTCKCVPSSSRNKTMPVIIHPGNADYTFLKKQRGERREESREGQIT